MLELSPLVKDLAMMLGIATLVTLLFQKIRQPVVLGYLVAGLIVGPYTPPYALVSDIPNIKILAELGVIFLMFSLGLEFSFHKLMRIGFSATLTGLIDVIIMIALGIGIGSLLGWTFYNKIFLGAALAISSSTIIVKALDELNLKHKRFSEFIFGILIIEDLLAILMVVGLSTMITTHHIFSLSIFMAAIKLIVIVISWFLLGYFLIPFLFRIVMPYSKEETLTIASIALCLILVSTAAYFHYSSALGAFIMGSILAETFLIHQIERLVRPIRDIFAAVFFISIGMLINPKIIFQNWPLVLLISTVTIAGKAFITTIAAFFTGQGLNTSLRAGFSIAQVGEFSFLIIGLGLALDVINNSLFPLIVSVSIITTFTTPYMIKASGYITKVLEKRLSDKARYFLESYSAWIFQTLKSSKRKSSYRKSSIRLILNGIIVGLIFSLTHNWILPEVINFTEYLSVSIIISWFAALLLSAPFIWGMLFSFGAQDRNQKIHFSLPLFLSWLCTLVEITLLSVSYFFNWFVGIFVVFTAITFVLLIYKHLEKSYFWFETQLINSLIEKNKKQIRYEELAPWDSCVVEIFVNNKSPFLGKTLSECHLREKFGINIVAIHRNFQTLLAPRGHEKILLHDQLIVLGDQEQIDHFRQEVEKITDEFDFIDLLEDFSLKEMLLDNNDPIIGHSIKDLKIREKIKGLVVGLERKGLRILNPDPTTTLSGGDLLLIIKVGWEKQNVPNPEK